ncbi:MULTISPECIES: hypothetical protein [Mycetohabitans]|uniref:Uncharacterized protein n=1 Tax=Mycetohabitans rhizoxinica TaxID=412963 RepID=A0ABZ2PVF2_9BURK|nr:MULTISPECIES: hypothetical protein [Mycetohabitans]MCF7696093.1 hypothetical protein [Mycetohabitans sp. B2]MCG1048832.1 hypothetical protein [Mycetohabitans sp. B6]
MDAHKLKKFCLFAPALVLPKPLASHVTLYPPDDLAVTALSAVKGHGAQFISDNHIASTLMHQLVRLDTTLASVVPTGTIFLNLAYFSAWTPQMVAARRMVAVARLHPLARPGRWHGLVYRNAYQSSFHQPACGK